MFRDDRFTGLTLDNFKSDAIAGITVGIVAIPLGMAFAIASGVKPEYGLYTTIIAGVLVALFGGSRFQVAGPTGAFIPILLSIVMQYGYENLLIAGFLAGIMLMLMGIFKLGGLIKFIPRSVTIGFTAGIAVIIFTGQIANFLGLEGLDNKEYFHENIVQISQHIGSLNGYSILTAVMGLLIIILVPRLFPRAPVLLIALVIPTLLTILLYPGKTATIGSAYGGISSSLPSFQFPDITWNKVMMMWQPAFVIAMLGGIESLLSAVVSDGMTGKRHHSNRELIGQGAANIVTPMFGGIPATGAIARTATNIKAGAVSPFSGVFQGVFVLGTLLLFAPYASSIPLASMAPILMIVAFNMSEYRSFIQIVKLKSSDSIVLAVTFLLTVFVNLTVAVQIGLLLAAVSFIKRMSDVFEVEKVMPSLAKKEQSLNGDNSNYADAANCPRIAFYTIAGPLFFGAADKFESIITHSINKRPKVLILKMKHASFIDATGANNLIALIKDFRKNDGCVLISEANADVRLMLKASGVYDQISSEHFFEHSSDAVDYALSFVDTTKCVQCGKKGQNVCDVFQPSDTLSEAE